MSGQPIKIGYCLFLTGGQMAGRRALLIRFGNKTSIAKEVSSVDRFR
jgi:hypothetical protein